MQSNCVETSQFLAQGHRKCHHSIACIWFPILDTKLGFWELWGYLATSGAKSDVIFLLGDPNFLLGRRNFASISRSYRDPHFGLFGSFGGFGGYLATYCAKSDVIFLLCDPDFLLGRRNFAHISLSYRDPHFGLFGFLGVLGVCIYFRCKIWCHILALWP